MDKITSKVENISNRENMKLDSKKQLSCMTVFSKKTVSLKNLSNIKRLLVYLLKLSN